MNVGELTERDFTGQIVQLATTLGYLRYHTWRSKHSAAGFPDEVLVRDRVIYAELKREGGKPSDAQAHWLTALAKAGAEAYLWRPGDFGEIAVVLSVRADFMFYGATGPPPELQIRDNDDRRWTPGSLWLPAGHRADQTPAVNAA